MKTFIRLVTLFLSLLSFSLEIFAQGEPAQLQVEHQSTQRLKGCHPTNDCPPGTRCVLRTVLCIRAPCDPIPSCEPIAPPKPQPSCETMKCSANHTCQMLHVHCMPPAPCRPSYPSCVYSPDTQL